MRELIILVFVIGFIVANLRKYKPKKAAVSIESYSGPVTNTEKSSHADRLISYNLSKLDGYKRFIYGCFIPTNNNDKYDVDVIMLHESGIYIFQAKDYNGWIFGKALDQYWMQTIPGDFGALKKSQFWNPIVQNQIHVDWLQNYLGADVPFYSYIVFGNGCELKDVVPQYYIHRIVSEKDIYWCVLNNAFNHGSKLTSNQIDYFYDKLLPLSQLSPQEISDEIAKINKSSVSGHYFKIANFDEEKSM